MASNFLENTRSSVAYGTAVVGYDLLKDNPDNRTAYARVIGAVACLGGGAVGDCGFELWIDQRKVGTYYNTSTGLAPDKQKDLIAADTFVPANALIRCIVIDAAPSSVMIAHLEFSKPAGRGTTRRRWTSRRTGTARRTARRSGMY